MSMNWKGFGRKRSWPNFKVISRNSLGGTEENYENLNQGSRSPDPRFEPGISRIRSKSVNHSTTTFGMKIYTLYCIHLNIFTHSSLVLEKTNHFNLLVILVTEYLKLFFGVKAVGAGNSPLISNQCQYRQMQYNFIFLSFKSFVL
jgi:hypothetical protein